MQDFTQNRTLCARMRRYARVISVPYYSASEWNRVYMYEATLHEKLNRGAIAFPQHIPPKCMQSSWDDTVGRRQNN